MRNPRAWLARPALPQHRGCGGVAAPLGLGVVLILFAGLLITGCGAAQTSGVPASEPPPHFFTWSAQATVNSATPQAAFAAAIHLTPCLGAPDAQTDRGDPPRSARVTWLIATPNYGLAVIQSVCDPPAHSYHRWLFELYRDQSNHWTPIGGYIADYWSANPSVIAQVPAWLPLPADTYDGNTVETSGAVHPATSVVDWDAQVRLFVFGHIADQAIRPVDAVSMTLGGTRKWMVTENGLTTVTSVLPDSTTLFFSGTEPPADVEALAMAAFAHVDEALQPLPPATVTPTAP